MADDPVLQSVLALIRCDLGIDQLEPIHGGKSGGRVFRLVLNNRSTAILKILEPDRIPDHLRQDYPHLIETEWRFYSELGPKLKLPLPELYAAGQIPNQCSYLLMEDLCERYRIPPEDHHWTEDELRSVLSTYALLHGRSMRYLSEHPTPAWLHGDDRERFSTIQLLSCLQSFHEHPLTRDAVSPIIHSPALEPLMGQVASGLRRVQTAVLYNDFYPPNVALSRQGGLAKLFDWQLVGLGPLHLDIVNIGFLGRRSEFERVERNTLINHYLDQLALETGQRLPTDQFIVEFYLAVLLAWSVFLPRMVNALHLASSQGKSWSPWMAQTYADFIIEWQEAVKYLDAVTR